MLNPSSKLKVGLMLLFRQNCCFMDYQLFVRWKDQGKAEMWHVNKSIVFLFHRDWILWG